MSDNDSKIIAGCFAATLILGLYVVLLVYFTWAGAVVFTNLWAWFIVPLFDVPELTLIQAAGLALVVGYLTRNYNTAKGEDDTKKVVTNTVMLMLSPWLTLLIGYIIHNMQ